MKILSLCSFALLTSLFSASSIPAAAQTAAPSPLEILKSLPPAIPLWPNGAPGARGDTEADKPRLYAFPPQTKSTTTAVLVIPGGGYAHVSMGHEGIQYARWLNAQGVTAFVLDYRVAPYQYPVEIQDGMRGMRYVRSHAADYGIDPNRIGVWGSSAGGHLASTLGVHGNDAPPLPEKSDSIDQTDARPNFMILSYPVVSMQPPIAHTGSMNNLLGEMPYAQMQQKFSNQLGVNAQTPMTFLFATTGDPTVPVENSLDLYRALERAHIPVELHIYDYADHGCGLCGSIPELATWPLLLRNWLIHENWLPTDAPPMPPAAPNYPFWPPGLDGPGKPQP
ncbi:alpha/beta hydrolase [Alloacidobacterium dinghuense]|uniref:Alpha/beta hydrolase n=1 Tax=Alloacidobacterium dinghuense TaxID=2763107 RepID=A0A7G8BFP9_9BACT|nr:alpha/beta hydrolase [Alloacidobacterium dinghuense]